MATVPASPRSTIQGLNVMLIGPIGSGKTHCVRTLIEAGITPFCVFTEPGAEVLGDIPPEKLKWHYIPPADVSWASMIDSATKINTMSFKLLSDLNDINKKDHNQFIELLKTLNNFVDDRTGEVFGDVCKWGTDRALVLDGMSGISVMAMGLMVGSKPVKSQADWGVAMDNLERLVLKLCNSTRCHFVLMAHPEREADEAMGTGNRIMAATLGRKLAPKIPRNFSDVIMTERSGDKFTWSTVTVGADLKARNVPYKENLAPSFVPLIESWKAHGGIIEP